MKSPAAVLGQCANGGGRTSLGTFGKGKAGREIKGLGRIIDAFRVWITFFEPLDHPGEGAPVDFFLLWRSRADAEESAARGAREGYRCRVESKVVYGHTRR